MADLTLTLLGLDRISASIGLALKRYMSKKGKHTFTIIGFDDVNDHVKQAKKMNALDKHEARLSNAVKDADLIVMGTSYEETETVYRNMRADLRDGVVILDASPLKQPSLAWATKYLSPQQHVIGITPILNPNYIFDNRNGIEFAEEDLFDTSTILITPSASSAKAAVDLAFNFSAILGSKPRFLDPLEHDTLLAQTSQLPRLLGTLFFYHMTQHGSWDDMQWLTNPEFGALTRPLFDIHPDALRDEFLNNKAVLGRVLDDYLQTLVQFRQALQEDEPSVVEAVLVQTSERYETWINRRYRADWDEVATTTDPKLGNTMLQGILGGALADKITGRDKDE